MIKCTKAIEAFINNTEGKKALSIEVQNHLKNCATCSNLIDETECILSQELQFNSTYSDKQFIDNLNMKIDNKKPHKFINYWAKIAAAILIGIFVGINAGSKLSDYLDTRAMNKGLDEYFQFDCCLLNDHFEITDPDFQDFN